MKPEEYRDALKALGYTQEGFALMLGSKPRTGQYWATVAVPGPVATIVRLIQIRPQIKEDLEELAAMAESKKKKRSPPKKGIRNG